MHGAIVVTGAAGFIGSHLVQGLNAKGYTHILAVDDLSQGQRFANLVDGDIHDFIDAADFRTRLEANPNAFGPLAAFYHQGANSSTTEWNGRLMMDNNYTTSKLFLHTCQTQHTPFFYASSAAVYGNSTQFKEIPANEKPLNVYGYSKLQFDRYVRRLAPTFKHAVVGLRYFNVYGAREAFKGSMASVVHHFTRQIMESGSCQLFGAYQGFGPGLQQRDFVWVQDIVRVNLWLLENTPGTAIVNVGSGRAQTFEAMAHAVIDALGQGRISYVDFPDHLKGRYQCHTQADLAGLRALGYPDAMTPLNSGVRATIDEAQSLGFLPTSEEQAQ